jgi:hypothetical protein
VRRRGGGEEEWGKWGEYRRGVNWGWRLGVRCLGCDGWQGQSRAVEARITKSKSKETYFKEDIGKDEERQAGREKRT